MAAASTALRWDFYRLWDFWTAREFRGGFLRIQLTTNTASLCTMLAMALAAFELVRSKESRFGLESWGIRGLIAFAVFVTGNRGGLIQLIMTFAAFSALSHLGARTRSLMITAGVIVLIGVATSFQSIDWSRFDERGTFQYRADLISASLRQISEAPLFGRRDYLDLGHFDHLRQFHIASDDFVDVVIYYLQIALEFGLVGLAPFVFAYFSVLIALYRRLDAPGLDDVERRQRIATISMLAPYLFVIATTSNVSLLPMLGTMMLGIGSAQLRFK
jgi:O-antigen ligase